ncbi:MAG: hypothetical protein J5846_05950 [Desulfovibrio sp.]|nr:hypothetical protein [Desulfovibrio sp.]
MGNKHKRSRTAEHREKLLEATDQNNRLLGYLTASTVQAQKLAHRKLVILIGDECGHMFFRLHNESCLSLPLVRSHLAGQVFADFAAEILLAENFSPFSRLQDLGYLSCPVSHSLRIFYVRMAHSLLIRRITARQDGLLLDADELRGLQKTAEISVDDLLQTLLAHQLFAPFLEGQTFPPATLS